MKSTREYRTPNGTFTRSLRKYIAEWRKITKTIESIPGFLVYAFDPDVAVRDETGRQTFDLPLWAAKAIIAVIAKDEGRPADLAD